MTNGYWIAPDGKLHEVGLMGHAEAASRLLNMPASKAYHLLHLAGYIRTVQGVRWFFVDVSAPPTDAQIRALSGIHRSQGEGGAVNVLKLGPKGHHYVSHGYVAFGVATNWGRIRDAVTTLLRSRKAGVTMTLDGACRCA